MTTEEYNSDRLTDEQRASMERLHERSGIPWADFLEQAIAPSGGVIHDYVAIPNFHGMYVGIEKDGYTHS
jgi:hypothetical protein